ncbi:MAG: sigma-70 family RNA polymerase sigma factor [Gaiellaceae bacterium]
MSSTSAPATASEQELLDAARHGDEHAFRGLVEPHQGELQAHCYRMLGSLHDAEDALQDALLRAWRGLPRMEGRGSLRSWLYRIATNACLDAIARRPKRVLPVDYGPPADADDDSGRPLEALWVEPYPDERLDNGYAAPEARYEQREAVELAFIAALQHLPGRQRAALILRDVLGFSAKEAAEALESTPASVNSALQRARKTVDDRLPEQSQQATMRALGDESLREIVRRFADAFESGEVGAILDMLADDAAFTMPPYASWQQGREAIADSWLMPSGPNPRFLVRATSASGQPALGVYRLDPETETYLAIALDVLTLDGARIAEITAFRTPAIFARFGLPNELVA